MGGTPYGRSRLCKMAFSISLEARCFALQHAIKHGNVTTLDIRHEFPSYDPTTSRDVLYVLARHGMLCRGPKTLDLLGRAIQQTYVITEDGIEGLRELHALTGRLLEELDRRG